MDCPFCGAVEEIVWRFVLECAAMDDIRQQFGVLRDDALGDVLMFGEKTEGKVEGVMRMPEQMWRRRGLEVRQLQNLHNSSAGTWGCR